MEKHIEVTKTFEATEYYCDNCGEYIDTVFNEQEKDAVVTTVPRNSRGLIKINLSGVNIFVLDYGNDKTFKYTDPITTNTYEYEACLCDRCKEKKIEYIKTKFKQLVNELEFKSF